VKDPRHEVLPILDDVLGCCANTPETRELVFSYSGLQAAFADEAPPDFVWWFIGYFASPESLVRMRRAYYGLEKAFADLADLHSATYGTVPPVNRRVVRFLQRRLLREWTGVSFGLLAEAIPHTPAERAARLIREKTKVEQWLASF